MDDATIKDIGSDTAATITARYHKGIGANGDNAVLVIQKTHGATVTVKENETGTLQAARLDKVPCVVEEVRPCLTPAREEKRQNGRRFKEPGEPMFTLTSQDIHGVAYRIKDGTKQGYTDFIPTTTYCGLISPIKHHTKGQGKRWGYTNIRYWLPSRSIHRLPHQKANAKGMF